MRPEKAYHVIEKAILDYLIKGNGVGFNQVIFYKAVNKLMSKLKLELADDFYLYDEWVPDFKDYKEIGYEMFYISDRFNTPARLKWLLFGAENQLFTADNLKK